MAKISGLEIDVDEPARMVILHPKTGLPVKDKEGKEAFIMLLSLDSDVSRSHSRSSLNSRLRTRRGMSKLSAEEIDGDAVDLMAALTKGWYLVNIRTGEPLSVECTRENAREIYGSNAMAWLYRQVDNFAAEPGNFSPA